MKKIIILLSIILNFTLSIAQSNYKKGFYLQISDLRKETPNLTPEIEIEKRTNSKIKMVGGNDYQLNPINDDIKKSFIKKKPLLYSDGKDLYFNCGRYKLQFWYAKVLSDNDYFVFNGAIPMLVDKYGYKVKELTQGKFIGFGGAFTGLKLALLRFPYLYNKKTGKVDLITDKNIRNFISSNSEILEKYEKEDNKNDLAMILDYLIEWNK